MRTKQNQNVIDVIHSQCPLITTVRQYDSVTFEIIYWNQCSKSKKCHKNRLSFVAKCLFINCILNNGLFVCYRKLLPCCLHILFVVKLKWKLFELNQKISFHFEHWTENMLNIEHYVTCKIYNHFCFVRTWSKCIITKAWRDDIC